MLITPEQIRAARALLKWGQDELSRRSGVSVPAIANIENERQQASVATVEKFHLAFEDAGVEFIQGGVRKRQEFFEVFEGEDAIKRMQEDVYTEMVREPGEVLFLGLTEFTADANSESLAFTKFHIQRLIDVGATEKILVQRGSQNFVAPKEWYRYMPERYFTPYTIVIYSDRVALTFKDPYQRVFLTKNRHFAISLRNCFSMIWEMAEKPL